MNCSDQLKDMDMGSLDPANQPETPIVQAVLEPLLDDFQYWFSETATLLASTKADCLAPDDRAALEQQIADAQQAVAAARTLMLATGGTAGVEMALISQWHQMVSKCWQTTRYIRQQQPENPPSN